MQFTILVGGNSIEDSDIGAAIPGYSKEVPLVLENNADSAITNIQLAELTAPFKIVADNCPTELESGSNCAISVSFSPTELGTHETIARASYQIGNDANDATRLIRGTGILPATLVISSDELFPATLVGETSTISVTLSNTGQTVLTGLSPQPIDPPFQYSGGTFPGVGGSCGTTIAISSSCTIQVEFAPETADLYYQTLRFRYRDGVSTTPQSKAFETEATGV